jgi:hypothetical protein
MDIAGAAPATTFLDEIVVRINSVFLAWPPAPKRVGSG